LENGVLGQKVINLDFSAIIMVEFVGEK
jgi:hypothetical protein